MKKITVLITLFLILGALDAKAQVGIGTPEPSDATILEILSADKGVLIPRVALEGVSSFAPIAGSEVESLLVYNTFTSSDLDDADAVYPGFYYWQNSAWQRIINQEDLNAAIEDIGNEFNTSIDQIHDLINYIAPSNPNNEDENGNPIVTEDHSTVVWDETAGEFYVVTYDALSGEYVKTLIDINQLISGSETNTFIRVETTTNEPNVYHYFSESAIKDWLEADAANTDPFVNMPTTATGVVTIDVVGDVVENFEYILNQETTYEGQQVTIEEIIQMISSQVDGNVIYTEVAGEMVFQYYDAATGDYITINLGELVASLETNTFIKKVAGTVDAADPANNTPTVYYYFSEEAIKTWMALDPGVNVNPQADMAITEPGVVAISVSDDVAADFEYILNQETTYEGQQVTVEEIIQMISSQVDGNVIYTEVAGEMVFQYYDASTGDYVTIDLGTIVTELETKTKITRASIAADGETPNYSNTVETDPTVAGQILYKYESEDGIDYLNITEDMLFAIENNNEVRNTINDILNEGGNVLFGDVTIGTENYTDVLYYFDVNGDPQLIDVAKTLIQNLIDNSTQLQELKNILGDTIVEGDVVYTGDTIEGLAVISYKGTTSIGTHTAETSGVDVDLPAGVTLEGVVGISLYQNGNLITTTVTDVEITGSKIDFNIGVGTFYQVLPQGDYEVIVYATIDE